MECKCGYEGKPEYGNFQSTEIPHLKVHMRCPSCKKTARGIIYSNVDMVEYQIRYPEVCTGWGPERHRDKEKILSFLPGQSSDLMFYAITCPACNYGMASAVNPEEYEYLLGVQKLVAMERNPPE